MVEIQTSVKFEAAHRQFGDESKCGYLHGHNWVVEFVLQGDNVNSVGYLENFTVLKAVVAYMDHKVLLHVDDPLVEILQNSGQRVVAISKNPTCENLAMIICDAVLDQYPWKNGVLTKAQITVWENDDSKATATWTPKDGIK